MDRSTGVGICKIPLIRVTVSLYSRAHPRVTLSLSLCSRLRPPRSSLARPVSDRAQPAFKPLDSVFPLLRPLSFSLPLFKRTHHPPPASSGSYDWSQTAVTNVVAKFSYVASVCEAHLQWRRVRVQSVVHWIWADVIPGWLGHSFTHLSRFTAIFRSAVRHCFSISRRLPLIAVSAKSFFFFYFCTSLFSFFFFSSLFTSLFRRSIYPPLDASRSNSRQAFPSGTNCVPFLAKNCCRMAPRKCWVKAARTKIGANLSLVFFFHHRRMHSYRIKFDFSMGRVRMLVFLFLSEFFSVAVCSKLWRRISKNLSGGKEKEATSRLERKVSFATFSEFGRKY